MTESTGSESISERGQGFDGLQREAANSAIVNAALEFIEEHGARGPEGEEAWHLHFDLEWLPADYTEIISRRGQLG